MTLPAISGSFRPGADTVPKPVQGSGSGASEPYHLQFLTAEERSTAILMGYFEDARLEIENFIRTGDLSVSDATFYRQLLDETNRIATKVNAQGATWTSSVVPEAYSAAWRTHSHTVVNQGALEALSKSTLGLITQTSDGIRQSVRQTIAQGILQGLPGSEVRQRVIATGLTNIPHWPTVEYRAGVIARTETMRAYNAGALGGMQANGAKYVRWVASPDEATCEICLPRDGVVYRIGQAIAQVMDPEEAAIMAQSSKLQDQYNHVEQLRIRSINARKDPNDPIHKEYADAQIARTHLDAELGASARAYKERTGHRLPRPPEGPSAVIYDRFARIDDALIARGMPSAWTGHVSVVDKYGPSASVTRAGNLHVAAQQVLGRDANGRLRIEAVHEASEADTLPTLLHEAMHATSPGFTTPKPGSISTGTKAMEEGLAEMNARTLLPGVSKDLGLDSKWIGEAYDVETQQLEWMRESIGFEPDEFYGKLHASTDRFGLLDEWGVTEEQKDLWRGAGFAWS